MIMISIIQAPVYQNAEGQHILFIQSATGMNAVASLQQSIASQFCVPTWVATPVTQPGGAVTTMSAPPWVGTSPWSYLISFAATVLCDDLRGNPYATTWWCCDNSVGPPWVGTSPWSYLISYAATGYLWGRCSKSNPNNNTRSYGGTTEYFINSGNFIANRR